jgi:hypothetical protein
MKDYVGGGVLAAFSATCVARVGYGIYEDQRIRTVYNFYRSDEERDQNIRENAEAVFYTVLFFYGSGQIFNAIRSYTYHKKPKPKSANTNATNFKPYDGLKLSIHPTQSGDYKVFARYDYTF